MAFKYDPDFDYYELFEMCMGDGTTEVLDDPEDFNEFLQALKDGRYDPDTGISPAKSAVLAPLTGEDLAAKLLELKKAGVKSNQEILKATGYWDGEEKTYSQANINFFTAKSKVGETPSLGGMPEPKQLLEILEDIHGCGYTAYEAMMEELDVDYTDFIKALSQAKFGEVKPEEEIESFLDEWFDAEDIPLSEKKEALLLEDIKKTCDANNSWYNGHYGVAYNLFLTGELSDDCKAVLEEFAEYIQDDVVGHEVSKFQYLKVAEQFCKGLVDDWMKEEKIEDKKQTLYYIRHNIWNTNAEFDPSVVKFVKRHPEWRDVVWEFLFTDEDIKSELWEPIFNSDELVEEFGDKIQANAAEMYKEMDNENWAEGIAAYGKPLEDLFNAAGFFLSPEGKEKIEAAAKHREMIAEECRKSKEIGAKREAEAAEERKVEKARKAARSDEEVWGEALETYYIDGCLTECDRFREFIEKDIEEIKDIHSDGNPAILINPPDWLVALFKANEVEFVGGDEPGEEEDEEDEYEEETVVPEPVSTPEPTAAEQELISHAEEKVKPEWRNTHYYRLITGEEESHLAFEIFYEMDDEWADRYLSDYRENYERPKAKYERIEVNPKNNITVWYFDGECGLYTEPSRLTLNTEADALLFCETTSSNWGGHLEVIRFETIAAGVLTQHLPAEGDKYKWMTVDYSNMLDNISDDTPEFLEFIGGEEKLEDLTLDEFKEYVRKGQYPNPTEGGSDDVAAELDEEDIEAIIENFNTAGTNPNAFDISLGQYLLHQEFTKEVIELFKEIYSTTNTDELGIEEMPSEEAFITYAKRAVCEAIETRTEYQISSPDFHFAHLYWAIEGTDEEIAKEMYDFVIRNPQHKNLPRRFAEFMFDSSESGMEHSNYLSLQEPFWSVIKHHIVANKNIPNPFYSGGAIDEIICSHWGSPIAELLDNPEMIEVFGKHGIKIIPIEGKQVEANEDTDFSGKRVCVTGKLSKTRKEVEAALEAAGAEIASAVTKTTDLLVVGKDAGSKLQKAQELGTKVMTEEELDEALSGTTEHKNIVEAVGHYVVVSVGFKDWEKHYKSASVVELGGLMGTKEIFKSDEGELKHTWTVRVEDFNSAIVCDLFPELKDGVEDFDIQSEYDLNEQQQIAYYKEAFKRGACELTHSGRMLKEYSDDEVKMENDDIARALGLDPVHTSVSFNG